MIILLLSLLFLEILLILAAGIRFFIKYFQFMKKGMKFQQQELSKFGQMLGFIGLIVAVGVPRILGVRYNHDQEALIIYVIVVFLGAIFLIMGPRLILLAYKSEEKNPKWIKWILSFRSKK